jgi:asparagine synthase (glutamine-hydrolysing)
LPAWQDRRVNYRSPDHISFNKMCGIAGILQLDGAPAEESRVRCMAEVMSHRGPDASGFFSEGPVALGHLRLSIIDLSVAANQPFVDHTGRYRIIFNGEIYNFREVKAMLPDYPFTTKGDTEVLLAAYIKWGAECLRHFRGMFAFAIWDSAERQLFMARDPMGVKPLYYYKDENRWLFASEIRGILASGLVERKLSTQALYEFFCFQSVSYPYSPIEGIRQLQAGSWLRIGRGVEEGGCYWDLTQQAPDHDFSDPGHTGKRIRELMLGSVQRRLVSDVPVGAFLSGGIDSSAVVGLMAEAGTSRPNTFTVAFEEEEYDESEHAELIARKFNTHHTRILLKPTVFLDELRSALDAMDTPSGDGINTYVVSKAIREKGMTVALSGAGGDELFAGYPFFGQYLQLQKRKALWKLPLPLRTRMAGWRYPGTPDGREGRMKQLLQLPSVEIDEVYPVFRQILSPHLLDELTRLTRNGAPVPSVVASLEARKKELGRMPLLSQVSVAEYLGYTQHTLLKDTDQMSMAVSLEVREPFFDQDLVEFVLAVPDRLKKPIYPKSLLVESLKPLLPDEIVFRKKQGFLFPWNLWLKNELRDFCQTHLTAIAQRDFVDADRLMDRWKRFLSGDARVRWAEIWLFVVLEYWMEKNGVS